MAPDNERVQDAATALYLMSRQLWLETGPGMAPAHRYDELIDRWATVWCGGDADLIDHALKLFIAQEDRANPEGEIYSYDPSCDIDRALMEGLGGPPGT